MADGGDDTNFNSGAPQATVANRQPSSQRSVTLWQKDAQALDGSARAEAAQSRSTLAAFLGVIEKLERVLDLETHMLNQNKPIALHDFNHQKSLGLLELSRAMSACSILDRAAFDREARAPLARLRGKLDRNLASLATHLAAVGEIASTIARAIEDHESDGTYTARRYASKAQT